jgi:PPOX class probable F420-dependent enzyme
LSRKPGGETVAEELKASLEGGAVPSPVQLRSHQREHHVPELAMQLVWTGASTWKVKRIRRDPHVFVAKSNYRGRERGPRLEGRARIVDDVDVKKLIREKYGWQMRLLERFGGGGASVALEVQGSPSTDSS